MAILDKDIKILMLKGEKGDTVSAEWGTITGDISAQTDLTSAVVDLVYLVGSIYMSVNNANPSTLFGGTWVSWGTGRVPVGVDTEDTDFARSEKTGGEKTHTLTTAEMPSHRHPITRGFLDNETQSNMRLSGEGPFISGVGFETDAAGGNGAHNNLPPYITCYMWKRIE